MNDHDPECECRLCRAPIKVENLVGENARLREALEACLKVLEGSKADLDATGMGQPAWGRLIRAVNLGNAALGKSNV